MVARTAANAPKKPESHETLENQRLFDLCFKPLEVPDDQGRVLIPADFFQIAEHRAGTAAGANQVAHPELGLSVLLLTNEHGGIEIGAHTAVLGILRNCHKINRTFKRGVEG
jgi:hypothetical protein